MGLKFLLSLLSDLTYRNRGAENEDQSFRAGLPSKLLPAASWLRCNTGRGLLPLPAAMVQHSQALLPEDPVSVQNNCFAWQLTSRYLFEGGRGCCALELCWTHCRQPLDSVLVPRFCSPWSLSALLSLCTILVHPSC